MLCSRGRISGDAKPAPLIGKEPWLGSCPEAVPVLGRLGSKLRWVAEGCTSVPLPIERAATGGRDGITCRPGGSKIIPQHGSSMHSYARISHDAAAKIGLFADDPVLHKEQLDFRFKANPEETAHALAAITCA